VNVAERGAGLMMSKEAKPARGTHICVQRCRQAGQSRGWIDRRIHVQAPFSLIVHSSVGEVSKKARVRHKSSIDSGMGRGGDVP